MATHSAERERIIALFTALHGAGVTVYRLAVELGRPYNTVLHWRATGRVDQDVARSLELVYARYCQPYCQISPAYCETSQLSTSS